MANDLRKRGVIKRKEKYKAYSHVGTPIHAPNYTPVILKEWPQVDFTADNVQNTKD